MIFGGKKYRIQKKYRYLICPIIYVKFCYSDFILLKSYI